ncbi:trehalase [Synechococcus sp. PCC 7335]|uniref:trehalase family glycosidase n=1 Tax=Synechococcus sp. (strain ATCC 29403 / PCC 7335) TaxID=91464 RepID=UPI00017ED1E5|nr:trehalase family glycosidase [Synechococcus sp. PCC 7335]EDX85315.1 trehalase [Synechococcus sp. PCC 7335]
MKPDAVVNSSQLSSASSSVDSSADLESAANSTSTCKSSYPTAEQIAAVRKYINRTWRTLRRGHDHILTAARDSKVEHESGRSWPVYISAKEDPEAVADTLRRTMSAEFSRIRIETLPEQGEIEDHGLLYLPGDYIVPGGRFNELYGWDSYFILLGLLQDNQLEMAKSLTDQLLYQVVHYGTVLNANRTYFLGRSQPPLLANMVLKIYARTQDADWLRSTLPTLIEYYDYWMVEPHLDKESGLSRFYASGEGPAPEVIVSEVDEEGRTHFDRIREFYKHESIEDYDVSLFYNEQADKLTDLFFKGDRSMRESGFDPTNRFGPFSVDIVHYLPVCLNVLLHMMEQDIAEVYRALSKIEKADYAVEIKGWQHKALLREQSINKYLWDESEGLYLDYYLTTGERHYYEFATTFYPLWAGVASKEQAAAVVEHLVKFEAPGGVRTSTQTSGNQWDDPFGWAPLQLIAVKGLGRYGYHEEAKRLAKRFITLVVDDFERSGSLLEKYDLETCSGEVSDEIQYGYSSNEIGFGWTNGVVLELLAILEQ